MKVKLKNPVKFYNMSNGFSFDNKWHIVDEGTVVEIICALNPNNYLATYNSKYASILKEEMGQIVSCECRHAYYSPENDNYYCILCQKGMGTAFYNRMQFEPWWESYSKDKCVNGSPYDYFKQIAFDAWTKASNSGKA